MRIVCVVYTLRVRLTLECIRMYVCVCSIKGVLENWKRTIISEEIILMRSLNVVKSR